MELTEQIANALHRGLAVVVEPQTEPQQKPVMAATAEPQEAVGEAAVLD